MSHINEIVNLTSFDEVFTKLFEKDRASADNTYKSLKASIDCNHQIIKKENIQTEELKSALFMELITMQSQASQFLSITEDLSKKRGDLWEASAPSTRVSLMKSSMSWIYTSKIRRT